MTYRKASIEEIDQLKTLLWEFGPNEWNCLTPEGVDDEFSLIENGNAQAFVALNTSEIIGFAVLIDGQCVARKDSIHKLTVVEYSVDWGGLILRAVLLRLIKKLGTCMKHSKAPKAIAGFLNNQQHESYKALYAR